MSVNSVVPGFGVCLGLIGYLYQEFPKSGVSSRILPHMVMCLARVVTTLGLL